MGKFVAPVSVLGLRVAAAIGRMRRRSVRSRGGPDIPAGGLDGLDALEDRDGDARETGLAAFYAYQMAARRIDRR